MSDYPSNKDILLQNLSENVTKPRSKSASKGVPNIFMELATNNPFDKEYRLITHKATLKIQCRKSFTIKKLSTLDIKPAAPGVSEN